MTVALCATAIVVLALLWEISHPAGRAHGWPAARATRRAAHGDDPGGYDPGRERRAEQRARELLRSRASTRRSGRCTATSASSACGAARRPARATHPSRDLRGVPYAYLIYPHKPIVAYLPQTGQLLNEYCVEFPDETRPYGSPRLPDSDDVLAKWMALSGDERRLIAEANMHLPGRQVDPQQVQRDLWRLGQWERERLAAPRRRPRRTPPRRAARRAAASSSRVVARPSCERPGPDPKHNSRAAHRRPRARRRARLPKGIGFDDEALAKPIIGVANTWIETMPCNFHLRALAAKVKEGIRDAGGTPMEFNTIAISDGITMGTSGMKRQPRQPRGDRRLDRARRARPPLRRGRRARRLRQDDPGHRDGARAARPARA